MLSAKFNPLLQLFMEGKLGGLTNSIEVPFAAVCAALPSGDALINLEAFNRECGDTHLGVEVHGERCRLCFYPGKPQAVEDTQFLLPLQDRVKTEQLLLL